MQFRGTRDKMSRQRTHPNDDMNMQTLLRRVPFSIDAPQNRCRGKGFTQRFQNLSKDAPKDQLQQTKKHKQTIHSNRKAKQNAARTTKGTAQQYALQKQQLQQRAKTLFKKSKWDSRQLRKKQRAETEHARMLRNSWVRRGWGKAKERFGRS